MNKKTYSPPELKSRKIDLGVFGSYGSDGGDDNDGGCDGGGGHGGGWGGWGGWFWKTALPAPVPSVLSLNLKMK